MTPTLTIEKMSDNRGHCACCGRESRTAVGFLYNGGDAVGAYYVHWTVGHLSERGANIDLVLGRWGDEAGPDERYVVATLVRFMEDAAPSLMVIDADSRPVSRGVLAGTALRRSDVIGTPLAPQVFALTDAILLQDDRLF